MNFQSFCIGNIWQTLSFFFLSALAQLVKVLKAWPELAPEQHYHLPLLSCEEPGGQVGTPLNNGHAGKSLFLVGFENGLKGIATNRPFICGF